MPCNASAPELRAAYEKYRDDGFEILSVSIQEDEAALGEFIDRYGLEYPFLLDPDGRVSLDYGVSTTPTTFFIDPDGEIVDVLAGTVDRRWLERNIARVT